jgi:uncharacterized membrane protein YcaP (DUF421 family)
MMHDLTHLDISVTEKVIRTVAVYLAIAVLLRIAGKRDLAQLNTFDLVVVLLLSNVVQNSIIGPDNSLLGGLLGAAVLLAINGVLVRLSFASGTFARLFEGTDTVVVRDGKYDERSLAREGLRRADLMAALKKQGASDVGQVAEATLGGGGAIVVDLKPEATPATRADLDAVVTALARIEKQLASRKS